LFSLITLGGCRLCGLHERNISGQELLDACPTQQRAALRHELSVIQKITAAGVTAGRQHSTDTTWDIWQHFCESLHYDPFLTAIHDPIPLLQIFAHRYSTGILAPSGSPVRSRTVEAALRAVGQTLATLGNRDPRLQPSGKLDLRLSRQLSVYKKLEPPPSRVKPIPFHIIARTAELCRIANTTQSHAIADMLVLGFFFLLRPGEYACTYNDEASPFRYCDVHLMIGNRRLNHFTCHAASFDMVNFVALEFTNQKNGVRGELVGQGASGHPTWCPIKALIGRITHLRLNNADHTTPLYSYRTSIWQAVTTTLLTYRLRSTVLALGDHYGINPTDISIRSLRSSGAMALLCANVDTDMIRLLGRWRSDEMLRYLHVQSFPLLAPLAQQMLRHGDFSLLPNQPMVYGEQENNATLPFLAP
jgi:hypothetical protein